MKNRFEAYNRKAVFSEVKDYCHLSKPFDYVEVIQWNNGEGFDVDMSTSQGNETLRITYGQWRLLKKLVKALDEQQVK